MNRSARFRIGTLATLLLAGVPLIAQDAQPGPAKGRARSPFLPKGHGEASRGPLNAPTNTPLDQLEFRGIVTMGGQTSLSLFDPAANRGYWMKEGESQAGYTLVSHNKSGQSIVVRSSAGERSIPLKAASTGNAAAAAPGGNRPGLITPLASGMNQAAGGVVGPSAASLPSGSFPVGTGQPAPNGYTLAQALPSTMPNALPAGSTFAIPAGNPIPPGFAPVGAAGAGQQQQPSRRRVIVNPQQPQPQQR
jgi:hypothetical protein